MKTLCKAILLALAITPAAFAATKGGSTLLISKSSLGNAGNDESSAASVATGGKSVAFVSRATNFVAGDGNKSRDIFVTTGKKLQRASINSLGYEATDDAIWDGDGGRADSWSPMISAKGTAVVFVSEATNLDLETENGPILSNGDDAYNTLDDNTVDDIYLRDIAKKKTYRISGKMNDCTASATTCTQPGAFFVKQQTTQDSKNPAISADGRFIAYTTETPADTIADNFSGSDTSNQDVFLHDTKTHRTDLISGLHGSADITDSTVSTFLDADSDDASISSDGRLVVFTSTASGLIEGGEPFQDNDGDEDVFAYDRINRKMLRISVKLDPADITPPKASIAAANGKSFSNRYSVAGAKGRYFVAFHSKANNLDSLDTETEPQDFDNDVFVADIQTDTATNQLFVNEIRRVSGKVALLNGLVTEEANGNSINPAIAATGTTYTVAFESEADNMLTPLFSWQEDSNEHKDIYVYDGKTKLMSRASLDLEGFEPSEDSENPAISSDGRSVVFDTQDEYMVIWDGNRDTRDVFLRRR